MTRAEVWDLKVEVYRIFGVVGGGVNCSTIASGLGSMEDTAKSAVKR